MDDRPENLYDQIPREAADYLLFKGVKMSDLLEEAKEFIGYGYDRKLEKALFERLIAEIESITEAQDELKIEVDQFQREFETWRVAHNKWRDQAKKLESENEDLKKMVIEWQNEYDLRGEEILVFKKMVGKLTGLDWDELETLTAMPYARCFDLFDSAVEQEKEDGGT